MLYDMVAFLEDHNVLLSLLSSFLMLMVTAIYAGITWWQAKNSKKTLLESIKQNREERQPYVIPTIKEVRGGAFDTSSYTRIQLNFDYELENIGDSAAVTVNTFLYARMEYQTDHKLVYAHLMPNYEHSLKVGQKIEGRIHFETSEFREIIEDLEICYAKNMKRIETDASVSAYRGPIIILRTLYKNMVGQWFESVMEQELLDVEKPSRKPQKEVEVDGKILKLRNPGQRVTNKNIKAGDVYEGGMINPSYSRLSRTMVDYDYVKKILDECREMSNSKLEYYDSDLHS